MATRCFRFAGALSLVVGITMALALSAVARATPAPVTVGHSGWFWGSPRPQGKDLSTARRVMRLAPLAPPCGRSTAA